MCEQSPWSFSRKDFHCFLKECSIREGNVKKSVSELFSLETGNGQSHLACAFTKLKAETVLCRKHRWPWTDPQASLSPCLGQDSD